MIAALLGKLGVEGVLKLGRGALLALLFAAGGLGFWRGMAAIERMVLASAEAATATANALNTAAIEKSNAEAAAVIAAQTVAAARRDAEAAQTISGLQTALTEWETRNVNAPGGGTACLDAADIRDLNSLRRRSGAAATPDHRR